MSLKLIKDFAATNDYGLKLTTIRSLVKDASRNGLAKALRRVSKEMVFIDEELFEEWVHSKEYYAVKRIKKAQA